MQKKPDAEFNTLEADQKMPFYTDGATAWLPYTYYFFYLYFTRDQRWNFSRLEEPGDGEADAGCAVSDGYGEIRRGLPDMIKLFAAETPLIMLWQPNQDAVMVKSLEGFTYQFYRQTDFRDLRRV